MKTLLQYKQRYERARTSKGRTTAMNSAMLNLNHAEKQEFMNWQVKQMTSSFINQK